MKTLTVVIMIVAYITDVLLTNYAIKNGLALKNIYIHNLKKYSLAKREFVKLLGVLFFIYFLLYPNWRVSMDLVPFLYAFVIVKIGYEIIKSKDVSKGNHRK